MLGVRAYLAGGALALILALAGFSLFTMHRLDRVRQDLVLLKLQNSELTQSAEAARLAQDVYAANNERLVQQLAEYGKLREEVLTYADDCNIGPDLRNILDRLRSGIRDQD